jgi:hypothetical protein
LADSVVFVRGSAARKIFIDQPVAKEQGTGGRKVFKITPPSPVLEKKNFDIPEKLKVMWF